MHQKLADLNSEVPKHPAYLHHLVPSDYCLFPNLKKHLEGKKFSNCEEATLAGTGSFQQNYKNFSWMR
jgi:hypothetical protein